NAVGAGGQRADAEAAVGAGMDFTDEAGFRVLDPDGVAGRHPAGDAAGGVGLRKRRARNAQAQGEPERVPSNPPPQGTVAVPAHLSHSKLLIWKKNPKKAPRHRRRTLPVVGPVFADR